MIKVIANIKNTPEYASAYKLIVARVFDGELWFYGAFDEEDRAEQAANEISNGVILEVEK